MRYNDMDRLVSVISQKQDAGVRLVVRVIGDNLAISNNLGDRIWIYPALEHTLEGMAGDAKFYSSYHLAVYRSKDTLHAIRSFVIHRAACSRPSTSTIPPSLNSHYLIAFTHFAEHLLQQQTGLSYTQVWLKLGPAYLRLLNITEAGVKSLVTETVADIDAED